MILLLGHNGNKETKGISNGCRVRMLFMSGVLAD